MHVDITTQVRGHHRVSAAHGVEHGAGGAGAGGRAGGGAGHRGPAAAPRQARQDAGSQPQAVRGALQFLFLSSPT